MYQVLARKYRPRNFSQLVGQHHVAKALTSALERGRLHHAYLFTGTRGVGKTTIARILAKCLNCETGVTATPCETCTVCTAVNEGRFIDLIEIDAASRTGVDDTRELLNNVPYAPTQGRYKVYLIDEVHMFSNSSFNALLKTLEEPPEHVKFLFATTDPQKLPITVISRCLQFTLRPLAKDEIYQHLDQVLMAENIPHESEGLWQLAESAQGSLRDALSLTDQAIAYGEGQVLASDVKDMLGLIDKGLVLDLLLNIHQNQREAVAQLLVEMRQQAIDVTHVLEQMISTMHEMALLQCLGTVVQDQEQFEQRKAQIAQIISPQDLQLYYQIALQGRADLALSLTAEQGFEMCVMRLLAFRPLAQNEVLVQPQIPTVQQVVQVSNPSSEINSVSVQEHVQPSTVSLQTDEQVNPVDAEPYIEPEENIVSNLSLAMDIPQDSPQVDFVESISSDDEYASEQVNPVLDGVADQSVANTESILNSSETTGQESLSSSEMMITETPVNTIQDMQFSDQQVEVISLDDSTSAQSLQQHDDIPDDPRVLLNPQVQALQGEWTLLKWDYWLRQDQLSPAVKEIAQHGIMQGNIEGESVLLLDESYQRIFEGFVDDVEQALQQLHPQLKLKVQYQPIEQDSPFELQQQRKREAYQKAQQKLMTHPVVKDLMQEFNGKIEEFNLKP